MYNFVDFFLKIRDSRIFTTIVVTVILTSALYVGATTYDVPSQYIGILNLFDYGITIFFLAEIIIRLLAEKPFYNFFRNSWNIFDFLIVSISLIPIGGAETVFIARLLRIIRMLRIITIIPDFRKIIDSLISMIPKVASIVVLMIIFFYIWATIGSLLFSEIDSNRWGNVGSAMLVLLQIITYDDWGAIMRDVMEVYPIAWIYFVSFLILNAFILFNMIIGIVVDVMAKEYNKHD